MGQTPSMNDEVRFVHVDDGLLVVEKPAGMLCVPGRGALAFDALSLRVQRRYPEALIVHRLDMATSGLLLMARGKAAQRRLGAAFAQRVVEKRYVAIVAGLMAPESGVVDLPLAADWERRPMQAVDPVRGKPSLTHYRVLACDANAQTTRVELRPATGRSHQLRVHMHALGHPIVGDALYGPPHLRDVATRLMLHASSLRFTHPVSGRCVEFESAAPF